MENLRSGIRGISVEERKLRSVLDLRMENHPLILDNCSRTVADCLHQSLPDTEVFRLVSAYFSIYGYEMLQHELSGIKDVRFLFGDPALVDELDSGGKAPKSFDLSENGLAPNYTLQQKHLAQQCASWIKSQRVKIRSISQANFLHGKMYLTESKATDGVAVVGSSKALLKVIARLLIMIGSR